jgi:hypothetical protein
MTGNAVGTKVNQCLCAETRFTRASSSTYCQWLAERTRIANRASTGWTSPRLSARTSTRC